MIRILANGSNNIVDVENIVYKFERVNLPILNKILTCTQSIS